VVKTPYLLGQKLSFVALLFAAGDFRHSVNEKKYILIWVCYIMKTTQYLEYTRQRPDRVQIKDEWINFVIQYPEKTEIQTDGRVRKWAKIQEVDKYLRVILLEDGEIIHNAFFDRSFKGD